MCTVVTAWSTRLGHEVNGEQMSGQELISLEDVATGKRGVVCQLGGGTDFAARLAAMGLAVGTPVEVLQNRGHGPILVLVRGTRIALGRGEALKIMVEALDDGR
jgi:ferrous iron transport protein A